MTDSSAAPIAAFLLGAFLAGGVPAQGEGVASGRDELLFRQNRARQQMEELEDRMFQLSELIRSEAPDNAARLVLALQRSREELIVEEMARVAQLIEAGKLEEADEQQRRVVFRLKELRELILSTELDLLLKLKRLRMMNTGLRALEDLQAEWAGLLAWGETLPEDAGPDAARPLERAMGDLRRQAEHLEPSLRESAPETLAGDKLAEAGASMKQASDRTRAGDMGQALDAQRRADAALAASRKALSQAREELLLDLQKYIRAATTDAFLQILEVQGRMNREIAAFLERQAGGEGRGVAERDFRKWEDQAIEIGDRLKNASQLMEETEYSLALAPAARFFSEYADEVRAHLKERKLSESLLQTGGRLAEDLERSLGVLSEEGKWARRAPPGDLNAFKHIKLLTELGVLRLVQERIRLDTARLSALPGEDSAVARSQGRIARWEASIADVTKRLHARGNSELLRPGDEVDF